MNKITDMDNRRNTSDLLFRKAEETDIERIWEIIGQAKAQMRRLNSQQWDENYPLLEDISQDIESGNGYVFCDRNNRVVTYGVISFDGEPAYNDIKGKWSNNLPYMIVHRLAVADEMKRQGMARRFMLQAEDVSREKGIYEFRVDTNYDNQYMLRLIDALGFNYCGEVSYREDKIRKAFEKSLRPTLPYSVCLIIPSAKPVMKILPPYSKQSIKTGTTCASGCHLSTVLKALRMSRPFWNLFLRLLMKSAIRYS